MDNANKILQLIFYIIWVPLGILLFGVVVSLVVTNSLAKFNQMTNQPAGQLQQSGINQQPFQGNDQRPGGQVQQPNNVPPPQPTGAQR
ncbi:hypothetical protein A3A79_03040 [Candidatus Gottesmanbacteria bacterium RIFCSPLOWO2_01_FULL_43_11b]|uniref:Uncharacterized protein n=1 Tax=Candidatus Gottesmanbacteria bacterium RIFCSPLOWO2_01_FULL_43_11b TaxID=1798392 RepID=A0A1F6AHH6_9BACT|nr:MAG: hypothetical protein A3A79_03040 [Candidatus Gottesmanbacteria bacterium RIFCSPLOWO2_01_FULL_43_11b]